MARRETFTETGNNKQWPKVGRIKVAAGIKVTEDAMGHISILTSPH